MKTKNSSFGKAFLSKKRFALVEIAIVLCSVFLVALPVIAADQNPEMQKVSASTITTASEDEIWEYIFNPLLNVFGNANEDDTVDMRDTTYIKLVIFGKKPRTDFADANNDGKVSMLDVGQTKLIILGKEKEITFLESDGKIETLNLPIERIAIMYPAITEVVVALEATDKVVAVDKILVDKSYLYPELADKPVVGYHGEINYELMFEINPQVVLTYTGIIPDAEEKLEPFGIKVVRLSCYKPKTLFSDIRTLGMILGNQEKANEFIDLSYGYLTIVRERVGNLREDEKKRVYWTGWGGRTCAKGSVSHDLIVMAGGINIFGDLDVSNPEVSPEEVLNKNPQMVIKHQWTFGGYAETDTSGMESLRNELVSLHGWDGLDAVKNNKVYVIYGDFSYRPRNMVGVCYHAKHLYPELFPDLDPKDFHKEWLERFYGLEYKGIYIYPED